MSVRVGVSLAEGLKTEGPNRLTLMRKMGATAAALVTAQASCLSARAQTVAQTLALDDNAGGYAMATLLLSAIIMLWAFIAVRRLNSARTRDNARIASLEGELNEAEAVINSEPSLLFIWRSDAAHPDRIAGDLRGTVRLGVSRDEAGNFSAWLDEESLTALGEALTVLRDSGTAFNIALKTISGELIEADGRAAGGVATMRIRPLAGERRDTKELMFDVRRLGKQVEQLSAVLDQAPFPIFLRDDESRLVWVNQQYLKAVEQPDIDDVIERNISLIGQDAFKLVGEPGENGQRTMRGAAVLGGAKRMLEVYEVPFGKNTACFALDMTRLEDTRKALDQQTRSHASTLNKITGAIATYGADQKLAFYNAAFAQLWALDTKWLDSRPTHGEILDRLREERKLPEQANYRTWKKEQLASYERLDTAEELWHLPDGRSLRVVSEQPRSGEVSVLYEDVSEKIQLESRYNELIGVQRETIDNLHEGLALFGTDGCLRLFNPTFSRIWQLDEAFLESRPHVVEIFQHCATLMPDTQMWSEVKLAVTSLSDGRRALQDRLSRPDGMVLDYNVVPLPDGNTLITYVDVTASAGIERALRERNEALEAADRLKTGFMSNVSYELRTPLNSILGFASMLSAGIAGELAPKQAEYVSDIQSSSNDLLAVIDAILDLTTIDAGAMELKLEDVKIEDLLTGVANDFVDRVDERDLTLNIEIAEDAGEIRADNRRLHQTLSQLVSNAIGFSPKGATIRMGARRDGADILLWVADNGRGMDPDFQKKAFERFNSRPAAGGHRGPGLGLALVKSFVELHGGSVRLMSRLSEGTTVICRLPAAGPRVNMPEPAGSEPASEAIGPEAGTAAGEAVPAAGSAQS
jgi:signal transduction histidine kinase